MSWYEKGWVIFILLIVCFPLGCFLMWKYGYWHTIIKIICTIIFGFLFLSIMIGIFSPAPTAENKTEITADDTEKSSKEEQPELDITNKTAEEIQKMAQTDAEDATEEQQQQAIEFIVSNCENFYKDDETMAKSLYYGAFIAYSNYEQYNELFYLGSHIVAAIEDVYSGSKTIDDDTILLNLAKTQIDLISLEMIDSVSIKKPAQNTTAMVDYITYDAKAKAKTASEDEKTQAIQFIKETYPNYYTDNTTMEKTMYYGCLLEYAYENVDDTKYQLGLDTNQAVKNVYRGAETIEDTSTQENLNQIKKSLDTLFPQTQFTTKVSSLPQQTTMVWISTNGGTKYHKTSTCSNMDNPTQISQEDASAKGFSPCGRCYS